MLASFAEDYVNDLDEPVINRTNSTKRQSTFFKMQQNMVSLSSQLHNSQVSPVEFGEGQDDYCPICYTNEI